MSTPLEELVPEKIKVEKKALEFKSKFDNDLIKGLATCFTIDKPWRTAEGISKALKQEVSENEVEEFLSNCPYFVMKVAKEGKKYFSKPELVLKELAEKDTIVVKKSFLSPEDYFYFSNLHLLLKNYGDILQKYSLTIHDKSNEAFNCLVNSKNNLEKGLNILNQKLKFDVDKLMEV